ncbi:DNA excision repair protein ERCC-6-like [Trichomycterus rosablanca]|uniref:DNA excision repair protein ERCC-6-like n=1 Tax=Trichomycterus rosablanca TaxID=2290929 RepID=UPI002F35E064
MDQMKEMITITQRINQSLNIDEGTEEKYTRLRHQGKEAAQRGDLELSLSLFRQAYDLRPSDKLQSRIQRLEEAIQEVNASEEEEEFVDVQGSSLMLYKGLYDQLYEHQKEGVAFLYSLHRDGRGGGILADDMGLGKTVQVVSFLSAMYDAELTKHTLLVMPTSLIKNWLREFKRWTPGLRVKEFHGTSKSERSRNLERIQRGSGAIITTYQMLINNWQQLSSYEQREFSWDYIILDEAHKIKSSSTKTAKCVSAVPARHRLLLTGTPVQNNLREMWALFDFACQGALLGSAKTFKTEYENPITRAREKDATPGEKALGLKISLNLTELIKPYFLRRTKAEVQSRKQMVLKESREQEVQGEEGRKKGAEIPSLTRKTDLIVWTYLSDVQENIYRQFISLDHIKELLTTTRSPLAELTVLKKLCEHPRLLSVRALAQLGLGEGPADLNENDNQSAASNIEGVADQTLISESGKLNFLVSLLESLREGGKRTLVFSQSRKMLDIIERVLNNRKFSVLRVDGTVTQLVERERRIALFQTDAQYSVFLLTTQVGGVGLTLTAANRVVIFDPSWNPATDAQAVDRAYRIGQTSDVIIYRLITCGSVEEKIYKRQVFKDSLIRQTTGDKKNPFRYFTKHELKELFTLEDTRSSSTQLQLQSLHSSVCRPDPELQRHLSTLMDMNVFGVSRHDLLFSGVEEEDEDAVQDEETHYIQQRVQKAQELVQAESQLHSLINDKVSQNTEPAWLRLSRQHGVEEPVFPCRPPDPPVVVDLTQSGSDDLELLSADGAMEVKDEDVIDLSALTSTDKVEMSIMEKSDQVLSDTSPLSHSRSSVALIGAESDLVEAQQEVESDWPTVPGRSSALSLALTEPDRSSPEALTATESVEKTTLMEAESDFKAQMEKSDWSKALTDVESDLSDSRTAADSLQGNFNLQLEDSAELISGYEEEEEEQEAELSAGGGDFQLQMDITGERMELSNHDDSAVPISQQSLVNTPADDSILQPIRRKKKAQVIDDSDEGEEPAEEEVEKPVLASSPLVGRFRNLGCSTPKSILNSSATNRRSMNLSISSRRSMVESLLQDMEEEGEGVEEEEVGEEQEEDCSAVGTGLSLVSESHGTAADESVLEEEEPSGETLNSDEDLEGEEEELGQEEEELVQEEEEQSFINYSTDVELGSSETVDQCAPSKVPLLKPTPAKTEIKEAEETFESLVHSGKRSLAEGRKREALDLFLRAMDINAGDSEIQLLIIQLYRTLSQPRT